MSPALSDDEVADDLEHSAERARGGGGAAAAAAFLARAAASLRTRSDEPTGPSMQKQNWTLAYRAALPLITTVKQPPMTKHSLHERN